MIQDNDKGATVRRHGYVARLTVVSLAAAIAVAMFAGGAAAWTPPEAGADSALDGVPSQSCRLTPDAVPDDDCQARTEVCANFSGGGCNAPPSYALCTPYIEGVKACYCPLSAGTCAYLCFENAYWCFGGDFDIEVLKETFKRAAVRA